MSARCSRFSAQRQVLANQEMEHTISHGAKMGSSLPGRPRLRGRSNKRPETTSLGYYSIINLKPTAPGCPRAGMHPLLKTPMVRSVSRASDPMESTY